MKIFFIKYSLIALASLITYASSAKDVVMAFSHEIPPYIFEKENNGIEIDIIAAALAYKGHTLIPRYFPLGRIPFVFSNKLVDAAMGDMGVELETKGGFYADPAVIYQNIFVTLKSSDLVITSPKDLDSVTVVSFQGAQRRYPKWLDKVQKENRLYGISDQFTQVKLLHMRRYDVVLSDRYIFQYFFEKLKNSNDIETIDVDEHNFTSNNPKDYRPVFRDKTVRDDFNMGLSKLKESGEFNRIYDKYINE
jgi:polar amino acid transport system substrate-binding protein